MAKLNTRADHNGPHRVTFNKNRARIIYTQDICALCGRPVDKTLKAPHPYSATVDHIIPLNKGGHPSDINNLQLAHWICNRLKSDKLLGTDARNTNTQISKKIYQTVDWKSF